MIGQDLQVKICDFGSAKFLTQKPNSPYVVTQHYRAPELYLNYSKYDTRIDVWAMGCMLVEMIAGKTLIDAENEGDQFIRIIEVLGGFKREDKKVFIKDHFQIRDIIYKIEAQNLDYSRNIVDMTMEHVVEQRDEVRQVLKNIFVLNPQKRMLASELIKLSFFEE